MSNDQKTNLPVAVVKDFIELQREDIELRKQELELRGKEIDNAHEYSLETLNAQKDYLKWIPGQLRKDRWQVITSGAIAFILVGGFFVFLLVARHQSIAYELMKYIAGGVFGGGAGYGIGYKRGFNKKENEAVQE